MTIRTYIFTQIVSIFAASLALAQDYDAILDATLLQGWRLPDGSHMAAVRLDLQPGWHTYWRAPGDAGIPPTFDMTGSGNLKTAQVIWPRPEVYRANGLRSIVYLDQVVLPLKVIPKRKGANITLTAEINIGICKDICIPQTLNISATLPATHKKPDPRIAASLMDVPFSGKEAGVKNVTCSISPSKDGIHLTTSFTLPRVGKREAVAIETANPLLWVAEPDIARKGNQVTARTEIQHVEGAAFMINRSGIRITVLGETKAVDIRGCKGA